MEVLAVSVVKNLRRRYFRKHKIVVIPMMKITSTVNPSNEGIRLVPNTIRTSLLFDGDESTVGTLPSGVAISEFAELSMALLDARIYELLSVSVNVAGAVE
jgi:hypothetical protein